VNTLPLPVINVNFILPIPYRFNTCIVSGIGFIVNRALELGKLVQGHLQVRIDLYTLDSPFRHDILTTGQQHEPAWA
jgi:hypothetical protein